MNFRKHGLSFHCYADDTQVYLPVKHNSVGFESFMACLADVKNWLSLHFLILYKKKTEIIVFRLSFLSFKDFEKVIHTFILSRLDYCNSLYFGIRQTAISRLQLVQNAAARLLSGAKKREHITPILRSLHWLPACFRVDFKIVLLVYKSRNGLAPTYLCELLTEYQPIRSLRSSNQDLLSTPKSRLKCRGDRAFSIAAPGLWNALPLSIRQASSVNIFKSRLKTFLFYKAYGWWHSCMML